MKRQLTAFAFAGFLGLCCIGCPASEEPIEPVTDDPAGETELNNDDIDAGTVPPVDDDSNTTAAEGESAGIEFPVDDETEE